MPPRRPATAEPAFWSPPAWCPARAGGSGRGGRRSPALGRDGGGEGAVLADAGPQTGGHHVDVEHCGIGRVDAADHRCHEPVQDPPAHPPADQG